MSVLLVPRTIVLHRFAICVLLVVVGRLVVAGQPAGKLATEAVGPVLPAAGSGIFTPAGKAGPTSGEAASPGQARDEVAAAPRGIADLKELEGRIRQAIAKVTPSVVAISGGSGVVVNREGYVLTVGHVEARAGRNITVVFANGQRAKAVTLGNDEGVDAGMAKILGSGPWPHVELSASKDLKPGQWCLTLGYPVTFERGRPPLVRIGRVLENRRTEIITDGTIMGGDSGAPLFDLDGKLIGIGTKCAPPLVYNIHVPIDRFRDEWDLLAKSQDFNSLTPGWTMLGIHVFETGGELRIGVVAPGGPAVKAGLAAGDVLLKLGDQDLHRMKELSSAIRQHRSGDTVQVQLRRGQETINRELTLGWKTLGRDR